MTTKIKKILSFYLKGLLIAFSIISLDTIVEYFRIGMLILPEMNHFFLMLFFSSIYFSIIYFLMYIAFKKR